MRVDEALRAAPAAGLSRQEARTLLGALLGCDGAWLIAHGDALLDTAQQQRWLDWLRRAADQEPLAYLSGQQEFHGLTLQVTRDTLVPRPDTETLVDWALQLLPPGGHLADLGTGSGAIALAVKHRRPDAHVTATDRSEAALAVAKDNGRRLGLSVEWLTGSWWQPLAGRHFDVLLSNPPYIAAGDPHLPALRHEPLEALSPGGDGLDDLRRITAGARAHLACGGWLLLEHGFDQAEAVAGLLSQAGFAQIQHRQDLAGRIRCSGGTSPAS